MRQTSKTRRTIGIRGQLMRFLCFICLLLVGLFWFLSTQLLEPLYTTHIQTVSYTHLTLPTTPYV